MVWQSSVWQRELRHTPEKCLPAFLSFVKTWIETAAGILILLSSKKNHHIGQTIDDYLF